MVALEDVDPNGNDQRATAQKPAETSDFDQFNALTPDATIGQPAEGPLDSMPHGYLRAKFANESSLQPLLKEWDRFVQGKLKPIIDHNFHGIGHIAPSEDKHVAEVRVVCQEEDGDLVLIDTAGRDDFDEDRLGEGEVSRRPRSFGAWQGLRRSKMYQACLLRFPFADAVHMMCDPTE